MPFASSILTSLGLFAYGFGLLSVVIAPIWLAQYFFALAALAWLIAWLVRPRDVA